MSIYMFPYLRFILVDLAQIIGSVNGKIYPSSGKH